MRLVRFMGIDEIKQYLGGNLLRNETEWGNFGKSTSKGFCFFPADPPPESRLHYLSGVVSFAIVAEFETGGPLNLRRGTGTYRNPKGKLPGSIWEAVMKPGKTIEVEEYGLNEYSRDSLRLLRLGSVILDDVGEWRILWGDGND